MIKKIFVLISASLFLSGCATVKNNIKLDEAFWQKSKKTTLVIAKNKTPKGDLYMLGSQGLLDVAINVSVNKKFTKYLSAYDLKSVDNLKMEFAQKLNTFGIKTETADDIDLGKIPLSTLKADKYAANNFTVLRDKFSTDKLLIINVYMVGALRSYYGFFATSAPKAICNIQGQLVNLTNNEVLWRYNSSVSLDVSGQWDQPPSYPNFNKALDRAVATAENELLDDFFSNVDTGAVTKK